MHLNLCNFDHLKKVVPLMNQVLSVSIWEGKRVEQAFQACVESMDLDWASAP
jgi:hypothetical protein